RRLPGPGFPDDRRHRARVDVQVDVADRRGRLTRSGRVGDPQVADAQQGECPGLRGRLRERLRVLDGVVDADAALVLLRRAGADPAGCGPVRGGRAGCGPAFTLLAAHSAAFRSAVPRRCVETTTAMTMRPGRTVSHQAVATKLRPSAMMRPHSGVGAGAP